MKSKIALGLSVMAASLMVGMVARADTVGISEIGSDPDGLTGALETAYGAMPTSDSDLISNSLESTNFYVAAGAGGSSDPAALGTTLLLTSINGDSGPNGGQIQFTRLSDAETFVATGVSATFVAKWSGNNPETFGISNSDGSHPYLLVTGNGDPGTGNSASITIPSNNIVSPIEAWFQDTSVNNSYYYSDGLTPNVVTFSIFGSGIYAQDDGILVAFDDPGGSDTDYNDLVVEMTGFNSASSVAVPLPASAGLGFSMLAGFGALFAFRKRLARRPRIA